MEPLLLQWWVAASTMHFPERWGGPWAGHPLHWAPGEEGRGSHLYISPNFCSRGRVKDAHWGSPPLASRSTSPIPPAFYPIINLLVSRFPFYQMQAALTFRSANLSPQRDKVESRGQQKEYRRDI